MRTVQSRSFCNYSSVSYFYNHGFIDHKFIVRLQTRNHQVITTCWPARQKDDSHHGVNLSMHGCSYNKFDKPQIVKQCIETEKCFQQKFTNSVDTMLPITLGTSKLLAYAAYISCTLSGFPDYDGFIYRRIVCKSQERNLARSCNYQANVLTLWAKPA